MVVHIKMVLEHLLPVNCAASHNIIADLQFLSEFRYSDLQRLYGQSIIMPTDASSRLKYEVKFNSYHCQVFFRSVPLERMGWGRGGGGRDPGKGETMSDCRAATKWRRIRTSKSVVRYLK